MNTAIIVAGGTGSRFGGETPKQFLEIGGKPLLVHAIERFEESREIKAVVVVLSHDRVTEYSEYLRGLGFSKLRAVVAGGRTRAESV
ncbi:MAG TPA: 2-C-methyl-D-erythritol 4-phosphate cytidylyltransferase, partial [Pyrinomonadaceae bacterium]|nr:2-C-methyl-D-erythritol 4-phosphate cytidylyltransferase [Pyrinomonadaceae bacterium]